MGANEKFKIVFNCNKRAGKQPARAIRPQTRDVGRVRPIDSFSVDRVVAQLDISRVTRKLPYLGNKTVFQARSVDNCCKPPMS
jgi:hypothetical protein